MNINYRVVWVDSNSPDIVQDIWDDGIDSLISAHHSLDLAMNLEDTGGPVWYPRIQKVTYEFM